MRGVAELCESYKRIGTVGAALVADRAESKKLLAAFALAPLPPWRHPRSKMPDDGRDRWLWLWSGYEGGAMAPTFLDGLARVAGINAQAAYRVWPALMVSRLVFPDGTISDVAKAVLDAFVASAGKRGPGRPPKDKEEAK